MCFIEEFLFQVSLLQNESVEKNKSIQSLHNQICSFEIEIERQKEMLRNNESKILHLQVRGLGCGWGRGGPRVAFRGRPVRQGASPAECPPGRGRLDERGPNPGSPPPSPRESGPTPLCL